MLRCPIVGLVGRGEIPIDAGSAAGMSDSLQFSVEDSFRPWSPGLKYVASRRPMDDDPWPLSFAKPVGPVSLSLICTITRPWVLRRFGGHPSSTYLVHA